MTEIFVGSVAVGVVPDARGWNQKLRQQLVPSSGVVGDEVGKEMGKKITDQMGKAGTDSAGAFDEKFRKRLKAALEALPKAKVDGDMTPAERKLAELRAKIEEISKEKVIDGDKATRELAKIDAELAKVARKADGIDIKFNTAEARAQLALLRKDIESTGGTYGRKRGILGTVAGFVPGMGAGAGAAPPVAGAGQAASGAGAAASGIGPWGWVAAIGAGIVALPFIAQAAAGAVVAALGGAFVGVGILAAAQVKGIQDKFGKLKEDAKKDLWQIGVAFAPVVFHILDLVGKVVNHLTPVFIGIMKLIAGPFKAFADAVISAFTRPAVVKAMQDVAKAFGAILDAFTPDIPGIADSLAQAISRMADAVKKNPKAFADFLNFLFQIVIFAINAIAWLTNLATWIEVHLPPTLHHIAVIFDGVRHEVAHIWDIIYEDTIGRIKRIAHGIHAYFDEIRHDISNIYDSIRHEIAHIWDIIYQDTIGRVKRMAHGVHALFQDYRHDIASIYDGIRHDIAHYWDMIWNNTIGRVARGIQDVKNLYTGFKGWLGNFFSGAGTWLVNSGKAIVQGLWDGMTFVWRKVTGWISGLAGWIKAHKGPLNRDLTLLQPAGRAIMAGLRLGLLGGFVDVKNVITTAAGNIENWFTTTAGRGIFNNILTKHLIDLAKIPGRLFGAVKSIGGFFAHLFGGGGGSGVQRWAGVVSQALAMLGLPLNLAGRVLYQMQTESGGNPNAINNWDINAQHGDPSRGLLQVIGGTFSAFHVPGTSLNIYDPLANVAAAINYALHRYGPTLMSGGMGMGSGHGYDTGGWWPSGTFGWNLSGKPELVVTQDQLHGHQIGGTQYHAHFDGLTGAAIESHVRTAFQAMSLTSGALGRQGRRS